MAEIKKDLAEAMDDDLELRKGDGTFPWMKSHHIIKPSGELPDEYSVQLPAIFVATQLISIEPLCVQGQMEAKVYLQTLSVLVESAATMRKTLIGDSHVTGLYEMIEGLETLYRRETFQLSSEVQMWPPDDSPRFGEELGGRAITQTHLTFEHQHTDTREASVFRYIMKKSGVQTLSASSQLTVTHPEMLVQSDGGAVTMTSTPTIKAGVDDQFVIVTGASDTNYVTFQDSSNLATSGLKLAGKRNYTLGKNDSLMLKYDASQSAWVEKGGRADVY